jgi:transcriptional regulator with XRE-family HTH domain
MFVPVSPYALRSARQQSGLSLAAVARAAGTSASNVSAYERGAKRANDATQTRLEAAVRAGADSPIHRNRLVTVPAAAAAIRAGLRHGWVTADLLRVVRELRSNAKHLRNDTDRAAFYARPSTTGDRRWDALLAGVTEMDALRDGQDVPAWARGHDLPHLWFVGSSPSLHPHALVHTPSPLAVRGIVLDGAALESV